MEPSSETSCRPYIKYKNVGQLQTVGNIQLNILILSHLWPQTFREPFTDLSSQLERDKLTEQKSKLVEKEQSNRTVLKYATEARSPDTLKQRYV